jgi:hypothetical protein
MVDHGDYHISWSKKGLQKKIRGKTNYGTSHPLPTSLPSKKLVNIFNMFYMTHSSCAKYNVNECFVLISN